MPDARRGGIPDIALLRDDGGCVNPSQFAGHDLVVLFPPAGKPEAAKEFEDFCALADCLAYNDAYLIAIGSCGDKKAPSRVAIVSDPELAAWKEFSSSEQQPRREGGAVFLFSRGGCLRRSWNGPGHAQEVFAALEDRR